MGKYGIVWNILMHINLPILSDIAGRHFVLASTWQTKENTCQHTHFWAAIGFNAGIVDPFVSSWLKYPW